VRCRFTELNPTGRVFLHALDNNDNQHKKSEHKRKFSYIWVPQIGRITDNTKQTAKKSVMGHHMKMHRK
jgi:hypothetical protein